MELHFNKENLDDFQAEITKRGYRYYLGSLHNSDFYFAKTLHAIEVDIDESRSDLKIFLVGYDFYKYNNFTHTDNIHLQAYAMISRHVDERIELLFDDAGFSSLEELEEKSHKFYNFVVNEL
jgi:hypothetical protein